MKKLLLITGLLLSLNTFSQTPPRMLTVENKSFMIMSDGCYGDYVESVSSAGVRHRVYIGEYIGELHDNKKVFRTKDTPYIFLLDRRGNLVAKELTVLGLIKKFNLFKR